MMADKWPSKGFRHWGKFCCFNWTGWQRVAFQILFPGSVLHKLPSTCTCCPMRTGRSTRSCTLQQPRWSAKLNRDGDGNLANSPALMCKHGRVDLRGDWRRARRPECRLAGRREFKGFNWCPESPPSGSLHRLAKVSTFHTTLSELYISCRVAGRRRWRSRRRNNALVGAKVRSPWMSAQIHSIRAE